MKTTREKHALYVKRYRAKTLGVRCTRCSRKGVVQGTRCYVCRAYDAERKHPEMTHDTKLHAALLAHSQKLGAACDASGLPLATLLAAGMSLEVDRIDNARGYVEGNCQVIASYLNRLKSNGRCWPHWAIDELHDRVACELNGTCETRAY